LSLNKKNLFSLDDKNVYVAGHHGMVGSAILRRLSSERCQILTVDKKDLDLKYISAVDDWFSENKPEIIFLAAAKVGGIYANQNYPVDFLYENLSIQNSIISSAFRHKVKKMMFLGSSCIYPRDAKQPLKEEDLLTGPLEKTNEAYAIAKIAGLKLCQAYRRQHGADFVSVMPTNLYGPGDNFHPKNSHVVAALIAKFHEAANLNKKEVVLWGSGKPKREFLHVDDLADALVFVMKNYSEDEHINIGTGKEISINEFASIIKNISGWDGSIEHDHTFPDGTPRKVMDVSKINNLGWNAKINLEKGLRDTYDWYANNFSSSKVKKN